MFISKTARLGVLAGLLCGSALFAATEPSPAEEAANRAAFLAKFKWVMGPGRAAIGSVADIEVPAGYMFTGAEGTQRLLQAFGNPTSGNELGFLTPTSMVWSVVFEWDDVGYVKDDDKDKLNADDMLESIREGTKQSNAWRREHGESEIEIVGWEQPPSYNEATHNLEWAIKGRSDQGLVVNYNVRLLGRKGVMSATLLIDPEDMAATLPTYQALLKDHTFKDGEKYAEYRQGDKLAQYGLAALVVGGAAAGAAKLGLFAWLAVALKKFWKLIAVGVVAVVAAFKRLILGGRRETPSDTSS